MADNSHHWWQDDAITSAEEDSFGRTDAANRLAKLITGSHSWTSSIIFGLTGPWGSGKSSLIALASNDLATTHPDWRVVHFTPWATSDTSGLLDEFYRALTGALPRMHRVKFRRAAGVLTQVAAPAANLIPYGGGAAAQAAKSGGAWLSAAPPWDVAFSKAAAALKKAQTPILVVADDIDRLQTDELLTFLKVIRLLGRFPGVQHLIAYDEKTLFSTLAATDLVQDADAAARYMEKIVQYPVSVPPLLEYQLHARVIEGIERVRIAADRPSIDAQNWNLLLSTLLPLTRTPRAVDRYLAQVAHDLPVVSADEINDTDLLLYILLKQQFPTVANQLPDWKERLVKGHTNEMSALRPALTFETTDVSGLLAGLGDTATSQAHHLLRALFPKLEGGSIHRTSPTGGRHISDLAYFDRYFALDVPDNDITDASVKAAVESMRTGDDSVLVGLLTDSDRQRGELALTKARQLAENITSPEALFALIQSGAKAVAALDGDIKFAGFGVRDRTIYWLGELVARVGEDLDLTTIEDAMGPLDLLDVVRILNSARGQAPASTWVWEAPYKSAIANTLADRFVVNILERDDAPAARTISMLMAASENQLLGPIRERLNGALAAGSITLEDIAARLVSSALQAGETVWKLHDVDQAMWTELAVGSSSDPFYKRSRRTDLDVTDHSWRNRRRYAQGRLRPPPQPTSNSDADA